MQAGAVHANTGCPCGHGSSWKHRLSMQASASMNITAASSTHLLHSPQADTGVHAFLPHVCPPPLPWPALPSMPPPLLGPHLRHACAKHRIKHVLVANALLRGARSRRREHHVLSVCVQLQRLGRVARVGARRVDAAAAPPPPPPPALDGDDDAMAPRASAAATDGFAERLPRPPRERRTRASRRRESSCHSAWGTVCRPEGGARGCGRVRLGCSLISGADVVAVAADGQQDRPAKPEAS
eukprot:201872-Chlamydomonas_euryale.AAC.4